MVNDERSRRQVQPLGSDTALTLAARGHSKNMAKFDFFDHISPVSGEAELQDRIARAGGKLGVNEENIY